MSTPRVSIIITNFNYAGFLPEAIESALAQDYPDCEVLVLDEPTYALDGPGRRALIEALAAWPGGLVVASHDEEFLEAVAFDRVVTLGDGSAPGPSPRLLDELHGDVER